MYNFLIQYVSCRKYGLNPMWLPRKDEEITINKIVEGGEHTHSLLTNVVTGVTNSDCKLPCSTLSVSTR